MNKESIIKELTEKISNVKSMQELNDVKVEYTGKKGIITELQNGIKDAVDKKEYGMTLNEIKNAFNDLFASKQEELNNIEINK